MFLYAFDLIELNGDDLRRDPLAVRKATLTSVLAKAGLGIAWLLYALESLRPSPWARCDFKVAETFWSSATPATTG